MLRRDVTPKTFKKEVLKSDIPTIVDFWAPWCGPCRMSEPVLVEISNKHAEKLQVVMINIDDHQTFAEQHNVMSVPTTIAFKGGEEVGRQVGFADAHSFDDILKKII